MSEEWIININVWYQCAGAEIPDKMYARIGTEGRGKVVEFAESKAHEGIAAIIKELESGLEDTPVDGFSYTSKVLLPGSDKETPDYIKMNRKTGDMIEYRTLDPHELKLVAQSVYTALNGTQ